MTRKERIENELKTLEKKQMVFLRAGKLIQANQLNKQIEEKKQAIKDCEFFEYQPLNEVVSRDELTKNKVYAKLLEIALAADYLADCAIECKEVLTKLGVGNLKLMEDVEVIRKHANVLSGMPCDEKYDKLYDFMMDNDQLIDDIHTLSRRYISEKMKDTDYYNV